MSTTSKASFLFYDPQDLEEVVKGTKQAHEPQPYAILDVGEYLFTEEPRLLSCAFDRQNRLLYVVEPNHEQPLIHIWKIRR